MLEFLSSLALPALLCVMALLLLARRKTTPPLFDAFLSGATEGGQTALRLLPTLVALMVGVSMLRESGFGDLLAAWLAPLTSRFGIPGEIWPLVILRPVSGSGANALLADLFETYGPDSFAGLCASVLLGASDTALYIVAVYFSAVSVKRTRHTLPVIFLVSFVCLFFACFIARVVFGEGGIPA